MKNIIQISIVCLIVNITAIGVSAELEPPAAEKGVSGASVQLKVVKFDISPPLRDIKVSEKADRPLKISREHDTPEGLNKLPEGWSGKKGSRFSPHVLQKAPGTRAVIPTPTVNVEGLGTGIPGYSLGGVPPDTTGGVGPNYYTQWVNTSFAFFDKTGAMVDLNGDTNVNDWRNGNTIWSGFGGPCQNTNDGDPIVVYDQLADRWVMTQFGLGPGSGPHSQCVAVSTTGDPLGTWARTEYEWPNNYLNDYPKLGVWTDGYYLAVNQFLCNNSWSCSWRGAAVAVFDREHLIQGVAPRAPQYFNIGTAYGSLLPADIDGDTLPPDGSPGYFFAAYDGGGTDYMDIWETSIDWDTPANSTCGIATNDPNSSVALTSFSASGGIDQPGTTNDLDSLSPRLMFRAAYRNFDDHESVLLSHTVGNPAGMRWYEIRNPGGTPVLYQEGTYSPDADERWMGAVSMDGSGNIAMGYSVSGAAVSPSIRVTGRLAGDPLGTMTFSEFEIATGAGHQNPYGGTTYHYNRWGDYSTMSIDPSDDCTFWYTQEYVAGVGSFIWRTRIAAFKFNECVTGSIFSDGFESSGTSAWSLTIP